MDLENDPELHTFPPDGKSFEEQPKWRADFPIDVAQDKYQARRDFTKFLVLTSFAFVVGQFWIALKNTWRRSRGELPAKRIVALEKLPVGEAITFRYPTEDDPCLLIRLGETDFKAYASQCTHLQCPVIPKLETGRLHCPCHVGDFDLATGRVLAGPPRRALPKIRLEVKSGSVYATGIEEDTA